MNNISAYILIISLLYAVNFSSVAYTPFVNNSNTLSADPGSVTHNTKLDNNQRAGSVPVIELDEALVLAYSPKFPELRRLKVIRDSIRPKFQSYMDDKALAEDSTYHGKNPLKKYYSIMESSLNIRNKSYVCPFDKIVSEYYGDYIKMEADSLRSREHRLLQKGDKYVGMYYNIVLPGNPQAVFEAPVRGWFFLYEDSQVVFICWDIVTQRAFCRARRAECKKKYSKLKFPADDKICKVKDKFMQTLLSDYPMYATGDDYTSLLQYYGKPVELPQIISGRSNLYYCAQDQVVIMGYNLKPEFRKQLEEAITDKLALETGGFMQW